MKFQSAWTAGWLILGIRPASYSWKWKHKKQNNFVRIASAFIIVFILRNAAPPVIR